MWKYCLTTAGQEYMSRVNAGRHKCHLKEVQCGTQVAEKPEELSAVSDVRQTFHINSIEADGQDAIINWYLTNLDLHVGYTCRQIGIIATNEATEDVLLVVGQNIKGDEVPAVDEEPVEYSFWVTMRVSNAAEITFDYGFNDFVDKKTFEQAKKEINGRIDGLSHIYIGVVDTRIEKKDFLFIKDAVDNLIKSMRHKSESGEETTYKFGADATDVKEDSQRKFVTEDQIREWDMKPDATSQATDMTVVFTQEETRGNITSGSKLSSLMGKLSKWWTDFAAVVWSGSYNDLKNRPSLGTAAAQGIANNCTTTAAGYALDARQGKVLIDKANQISSDLVTAKANFQAGCSMIANTITACGVATATNATPAVMANNIQTIYNNRYNQGVIDRAPMTIVLHATYKAVTGDNGAYTSGGGEATVSCTNFSYMDLQSLTLASYTGTCSFISGSTYNISGCTTVTVSCSGVTKNGIHSGECIGTATFHN